jgi:hypothetical protein
MSSRNTYSNNMARIDTYKHLGPLQFELPMENLARAMCDQNYGVHRFLSTLVHELRAKEKKLVEDRQKRDPKRYIPDSEQRSPLADGIERLLNEGLFY